MLDERTRTHFSRALRAWGISEQAVEDTLRWTTFATGLTQMRSTDPHWPDGVAIMVDETQDEDLARMFALRERLGDDEFLAQWEASPATTARFVLDPTGPQALFRYTIVVERPERIERRFLFLVHTLKHQLVWLQQPGNSLWLIPARIVEDAPQGVTSAYEVISHCLPLGTILAPIAGLDKAIAHVQHHRSCS